MKVIIEQDIAVKAMQPRYDWIRGELNRCGVRTGREIAPLNGNPGRVAILQQVLTTDAKNFEAVADVITTYNETASPNLTLVREGYLVYKLKV